MLTPKFFPNRWTKSVYTFDFGEYYRRGYRGLIIDIDNTLVPDNAPATHSAKRFIKKLHKAGFRTCILSNSDKKRVRTFADRVKSLCVYNAHKPLTGGYEKAMELMDTDRSNTLFVGDQLFTDILGANNAGIYCILTRRLDEKERTHIRFKRVLEMPLLLLLKIFGKRKKQLKVSRV